jgi:hypothetical protein
MIQLPMSASKMLTYAMSERLRYSARKYLPRAEFLSYRTTADLWKSDFGKTLYYSYF